MKKLAILTLIVALFFSVSALSFTDEDEHAISELLTEEEAHALFLKSVGIIFKGKLNKMKEAAEDSINMIKEPIKKEIKKVKGAIKSLPEQTKHLLKTGISDGKDCVQKCLKQGLTNAKGVVNKLKFWAATQGIDEDDVETLFLGSLKKKISGALGNIKKKVSTAFKNVKKQVTSKVKNAKSFLGSLARKVKNTVQAGIGTTKATADCLKKCALQAKQTISRKTA